MSISILILFLYELTSMFSMFHGPVLEISYSKKIGEHY